MRGPSEDDLDRAFVAQHAHWAAAEIGDLPTTILHDLWAGVAELPDLDLSLVVALPALVSPDLERLLQAARGDDDDVIEELVPVVVATIDTPRQRARLARAILDLRDRGVLSRRQAAAAIIDLVGDTQALLRSSLLNAIFIRVGQIPTPGGLRVAA